jgi:hypothetical protein
VKQLSSIVLDKEDIYYLREAATYLETKQFDLEPDKTIQGTIVSLSIENQSARQVILQADSYGRVSFLLDAEDYILACNAHRDNRIVQVTGTLQRNRPGGGLWTLLSPRDFHQIDD